MYLNSVATPLISCFLRLTVTYDVFKLKYLAFAPIFEIRLTVTYDVFKS